MYRQSRKGLANSFAVPGLLGGLVESDRDVNPDLTGPEYLIIKYYLQAKKGAEKCELVSMTQKGKTK